MTAFQFLLAAGLLLATTILRADEATTSGFLVRPVVTDYQRSQLHTKPSAVAIIHADSFLDNDAVRQDGADVQRLRAELQSEAKRSNAGLYVILWMSPRAFSDDAHRKGLDAAVRSWAEEAGFQKVDTTRRGTSRSWAGQLTSVLMSADAGEGAVEPVVLNSLVRVSPINTHLSRFLGGDADCIVEIRQPFDGRAEQMPDALKLAIHDGIREANPARRQELQFEIMSTTAGDPAVRRLFTQGVEGPPINQFGKELGFATTTYSHSPCGGAPESLINQPAPDFTLERLEGGDFTLSEAIRGKPAFISFWGVACGPCRREAPHLTALHRKFGEQGFAIVAVNA